MNIWDILLLKGKILEIKEYRVPQEARFYNLMWCELVSNIQNGVMLSILCLEVCIKRKYTGRKDLKNLYSCISDALSVKGG